VSKQGADLDEKKGHLLRSMSIFFKKQSFRIRWLKFHTFKNRGLGVLGEIRG